jgi:hypothetical protein
VLDRTSVGRPPKPAMARAVRYTEDRLPARDVADGVGFPTFLSLVLVPPGSEQWTCGELRRCRTALASPTRRPVAAQRNPSELGGVRVNRIPRRVATFTPMARPLRRGRRGVRAACDERTACGLRR